MKSSPVLVRAKRGCLWYIGIAVAGSFGLLVLLIAWLTISSHNELSSHSIMVSTDDQTYLETVTSRRGFEDEYDLLEVYYVRSNWFWNKRVRVYAFDHTNANHVGFRHRLDRNGQLIIDIKVESISGDSSWLATFVPPAVFSTK